MYTFLPTGVQIHLSVVRDVLFTSIFFEWFYEYIDSMMENPNSDTTIDMSDPFLTPVTSHRGVPGGGITNIVTNSLGASTNHSGVSGYLSCAETEKYIIYQNWIWFCLEVNTSLGT